MLGVRPRMGAREDPRRRLAPQLLERDHGVAEPEQPAAARLDERPHERPVLVERRPVARAVLLEHELDLGAVLDLAPEEGERAEAEAAQGGMEVRCAHAPGYVPPGPSPFWQSGHQYAMRFASPWPRDLIGVPQRGQGRPTCR